MVMKGIVTKKKTKICIYKIIYIHYEMSGLLQMKIMNKRFKN